MSSVESPIPEPPYPQDPTPPVTLVLTILLLVMFFVGFFSIYFCRCFLENIVNSLNNRQTPNGTPINPTSLTPPGLDSNIVNSFPTFTYSSVKDYRREKYGLECAICLCEFDDNDILRLLTTCCHVFHKECIDLWFESHKSCPVCRRDLDHLEIKQSSSERIPNVVDSTRTSINVDPEIVDGTNNSSVDNDAISVVIKEDNYEEPIDQGSSSSGKDYNVQDSFKSEKFYRSHSTGHSILRYRYKERDDKYTLRIPEDVKVSITRSGHIVELSCTQLDEYSKGSNRKHEGTRGHIAAFSCTQFGDYSNSSTQKHEGFGEISGFAMQRDVINKV